MTQDTASAERININVWLPADERRQLDDLAERNERSLSAEVRRAIRAHIAREAA